MNIHLCETCGHQIKSRKFKDATVVEYCINCFQYEIKYRQCNHQFIPIIYNNSNTNARIVRETCKFCFHRENPGKLKDYDISKLKVTTNDSYHNFITKISEERNKLLNEIFDKQKEYRKSLYQKYLNSDHWKNLRKKAMERDNYTCQICHKKATEVHHLTYENLNKEHLFELVALCHNCHINTYHNGQDSEL